MVRECLLALTYMEMLLAVVLMRRGNFEEKYEKGYEYEVPCVPLRLDNMPSHSRTENRHGELR
jgi:hypothetical protein